MLGSVAPDSVHFRDGYSWEMKRVSHLYAGGENDRWLENVDGWTNHVLAFLDSSKRSPDIDFIRGYCAHILADIHCYQVFLIPLRMRHGGEPDDETMRSYHRECQNVDFELYRHGETETIRRSLRLAKAKAVTGAAVAEEVEKIRLHLLDVQYKNVEPRDVSGNRFMTLEAMKDFIASESESIEKILLE